MGMCYAHVLSVITGRRRRMTRDFYERLIKAMPELEPWRLAPEDFAQVPVVVDPGAHDWKSRRKGSARFCRTCHSYQLGHEDVLPCPGPPQPGVHTWGLRGSVDTVACTVCGAVRSEVSKRQPCPGAPAKRPRRARGEPPVKRVRPTVAERAKAHLAQALESYEKRLAEKAARAAARAAAREALPETSPVDLAEYSPLIFTPRGQGPQAVWKNTRGGRPPSPATARFVDVMLHLAQTQGVIGELPLTLALPDLAGTPFEGFTPPAHGLVYRYVFRIALALRLSTFRIHSGSVGARFLAFARSQAHLQAWLERHEIKVAKSQPKTARGHIACLRNLSGERITLPGYQAPPVIYDEATGDFTLLFPDDP